MYLTGSLMGEMGVIEGMNGERATILLDINLKNKEVPELQEETSQATLASNSMVFKRQLRIDLQAKNSKATLYPT